MTVIPGTRFIETSKITALRQTSDYAPQVFTILYRQPSLLSLARLSMHIYVLVQVMYKEYETSQPDIVMYRSLFVLLNS